MTAPIRIDLTGLPRITNVCYYPLYSNPSRYLVLRGGAGSGKSVFVATKIAVRLMCEAKHHYIGFRKVGRTLRTSVFAEFKAAISRLGVAALWHVNLTEMTFTYAPNGSVFRCMGMDDQEKLKSIQGLSGAWLEEATEFMPEDLEQINLRLRGQTPGYKQIILTFNPISSMHWIRKRFYGTQAPNVRLVQTTYVDNRFIDAEYRAELDALAERDPVWGAVYRDGEWGQLKGAIYQPFTVCDTPPVFQDEAYGLDFGFNHPTALVHAGFKDGVEAYLTEVIYVTGKTTAEIIGMMAQKGVSKKTPIYADAAEPDRIKEIKDAGYNVHAAYKGPNSVKAGIDFVRSLRVHTLSSNENLNAENAVYQWGVDSNGNPTDEPKKENDHAMDATRYACFTHLRHTPGGRAEGGVFAGFGMH